MQNDRNVLIWIGANDPTLREKTVDLVGNAIKTAIRETPPYFDGSVDIKVVDSPLRAPSLMEVIDDYKPGFFNGIVNEVADLAVFTVKTMDAATQSASHFDATTADLTNRIVLANDMIVAGALTDGPEHKQYYLDQALQMLNGDHYPHVIEKVKREQVADGVIELEDEVDWQWDKGIAP